MDNCSANCKKHNFLNKNCFGYFLLQNFRGKLGHFLFLLLVTCYRKCLLHEIRKVNSFSLNTIKERVSKYFVHLKHSGFASFGLLFLLYSCSIPATLSRVQCHPGGFTLWLLKGIAMISYQLIIGWRTLEKVALLNIISSIYEGIIAKS